MKQNSPNNKKVKLKKIHPKTLNYKFIFLMNIVHRNNK